MPGLTESWFLVFASNLVQDNVTILASCLDLILL